eukprot:6313355-Amphidinium_carterae.1
MFLPLWGSLGLAVRGEFCLDLLVLFQVAQVWRIADGAIVVEEAREDQQLEQTCSDTFESAYRGESTLKCGKALA